MIQRVSKRNSKVVMIISIAEKHCFISRVGFKLVNLKLFSRSDHQPLKVGCTQRGSFDITLGRKMLIILRFYCYYRYQHNFFLYRRQSSQFSLHWHSPKTKMNLMPLLLLTMLGVNYFPKWPSTSSLTILVLSIFWKL